MACYGMTVKECARIAQTTPVIVKEINKERLKILAGDMIPIHASRPITIDEFLIDHGHRYCAIVIDADTGELLYLERGKSKEQVTCTSSSRLARSSWAVGLYSKAGIV